ncbi:L domain-like protein [Rhizoclosmatium globosum]|uniref:L domain-like protein n=1 Tax=Rhizoclosmatium globosum TaxID=329046 RepID=A0A1Y2C1U3_9FUNG|nr:L domain-like protein [Rhizoclosmatium globosum]|eukprot:ORY41012.1 L domain-like protein [Rhizoclosmatium globosum]
MEELHGLASSLTLVDESELETRTISKNPVRLPNDVIIQILSWIHPNKVLKYRRLNRDSNKIVLSKHFALLNKSRCNVNFNDNIYTFASSWFHWPQPYQITHMGSISYIAYLDLSMRNLKGPFPVILCTHLTKLTSLNLSNNRISGEIPGEIKNLKNLESLFLEMNQLTGEIPTEISHLPYLETLALNNNTLSGPIPKDIGNLQLLLYLFLQNNNLSGPIPDSIGTLGCLNQLNLSNNKLSGAIPDALGDLPYIQEIDLSNNELEGDIPLSVYIKMEEEGLRLNSLHLFGNQLNRVPPQMAHFEVERGSFTFASLYTGSLGY